MVEYSRAEPGRQGLALPIEIILTRQLAGYLSVPLFLVDPQGTLLFYTEPAEAILGRRFDETGAMPAEEWSSAFDPTDDEGRPVPPGELPLMITLVSHRPAYKRIQVHGMDGIQRRIDIVSIPLVGLERTLVGAVALFWEV